MIYNVEFLNWILILISGILFIIFIYAAVVSISEKEYLASSRFFLTSFLLPAFFLLIAYFDFSQKEYFVSIILLLLLLALILIFIPFGNKKQKTNELPSEKIDERDIMFSRNILQKNTENHNEYYERRPEKKDVDDFIRSLPGLCSPKSSLFNPFSYYSADANFFAIKHLRNAVDGEISKTKIEADPAELTIFIKNWVKKLGALNTGICELKPYHLYNYRGRKNNYNEEVIHKHKLAIAFTLEMDKDYTSCAPEGPTVMESAQQYFSSGSIAIRLAEFIRNLGFPAKAHIDGNYEVVCPLVAQDAGLGEIGRLGLLMTPKLGPRVRIAVVTTDLPLIFDKRNHDSSVIEFCKICKKCTNICPTNAVPKDDRKIINGVRRWQINQEKCFEYWCKIGTDCGRCFSVCPYSHPDNFLHNFVRFGIRNSPIFRRVALSLDDVFYGRKPPSSKVPKWIDIKWKIAQ